MSEVKVYIYELSKGMAKSLSPIILGKSIAGIWHTAIVLYGKEIFFGSSGIEYCEPGHTIIGQPDEIQTLGQSRLTEDELINYLKQLSTTDFKPTSYNLFEHNCNTFTSHMALHLTERDIPSYIISVPQEVMSTPLGQMIRPFFDQMTNGIHATGGARHLFAESVDNLRGSSEEQYNQNPPNIGAQMTPVLFEEPLSHEVTQLLKKPCGIHDKGQVEALQSLLAFAQGQLQADQFFAGPDHLSLLESISYNYEEAGRTAPTAQLPVNTQEAIFEVFRVCVWRQPDILVVLLSDPSRPLAQLLLMATSGAGVGAGRGSQHQQPHVDAAKAKFLCNCLSQYQESCLSSGLDFPVTALTEFCLRVLLQSCHSVARSRGLALARNLAVFPLLTEEDALELGTYLLHLIGIVDETMTTQDLQHLDAAIYVLLSRFPLLVDLARAQECRVPARAADNPICDQLRRLLLDSGDRT